jgi:hypothetical protein
MVSISGKPDLSADGADRVIVAAEPLYADLRWSLAARFFAPVSLAGFLPGDRQQHLHLPAAPCAPIFPRAQRPRRTASTAGSRSDHSAPRLGARGSAVRACWAMASARSLSSDTPRARALAAAYECGEATIWRAPR